MEDSNLVEVNVGRARKQRNTGTFYLLYRAHIYIFMLFLSSKTIDNCSRLFGTSDTWSETVHYRPLVATRHPHREGA